jgi:hypothetical protein
VATHICDSVKRRLKADGTSGLQGEFGIGVLSFWTVGDELSMTSTGDDRRAYQMVMRKGDSTYVVRPMRVLFGDGGTQVRIAPLLDGSGISRRSCATVSGRPACVSTLSTGSRVSSTPSSRANTKAGCCISCRHCAQGSAKRRICQSPGSPPIASLARSRGRMVGSKTPQSFFDICGCIIV